MTVTETAVHAAIDNLVRSLDGASFDPAPIQHAFIAQRPAGETDRSGRDLYVAECSCTFQTPASRQPTRAIARHLREYGETYGGR